MANVQTLAQNLQEHFGQRLLSCSVAFGEVTIEVAPADLKTICQTLKTHEAFVFEMLLDVCGVDYLHHGISEWQTETATGSGFERGAQRGDEAQTTAWQKPRFASVYHLLSVRHNQRLRVQTFLEGDPPMVDSLVDVWASANWFEREAYDLYGILYSGHPDLRRILTDYGFVGHPFRKDFPLSGKVQVRYDAEAGRVIYEPVDIMPRILVPKVCREDNRYLAEEEDRP